jgi:TonB family protein
MPTGHWLKVTVISLIAIQAGLLSTHAQRQQHGLEAEVHTGTPPGLIKRVEPEFPPDIVLRHVSGRGLFRLTINPMNGQVDQVKIVNTCGYRILDELAAKALLQWRFQTGTRRSVEVPVEFYVRGGGRILHDGDFGQQNPQRDNGAATI